MIEILSIGVVLIIFFALIAVDERRNKRAAQRAVLNLKPKTGDDQRQVVRQTTPSPPVNPEVQPASSQADDVADPVVAAPIEETSPQINKISAENEDHQPLIAADEAAAAETHSYENENRDLEIREPQSDTGDTMLPNHNIPFSLQFENGQQATAVRVALSTSAPTIMEYLGLKQGPALFITGGAGAMTEEDIRRTREIIQAIADFAEEHHVTVIDGGTESGIMQMIGDARRSRDYTFTLIGVAPLGRVSYPGYKNPNEEAFLEDSHTHFVLVDGEEWGTESELLVSMANAISEKRAHGVIGVLINGGKITRQDVYLAVSKELPILVLEGSGRFADEVATAFKTGKANQSILRAILAGGDIQLVSTIDGPSAMRSKLESRFKKTEP